ncbi:MAG: ABC transporter substrate-binding protein [Rhodospirillaceae bacterium]|nr:ABC transporter substrate-binding protein [Rhodospirillaceae bacterium]
MAAVWAVLSPARAQEASKDEIVLGSTCAVTGQLAATGLTVFHALEMAVEDINAAGGVNGKRLRLVNEDAGSSNSSAVTAYVKLVQQHKPPFVFISSYSPQILAQSSEIARAGIGAMHAGGAHEIDELGNPWLFRIKPPDVVNTKAVASVVLDDLKKTRPGLIYVQNDYGQGFARQLESLFAARGLTLLKESYGPADNDMSAQLQSLASQGVDVFLTAGFNRDSALILRARKALGLTLPVVGQQALGVPATTDLLEPAELAGVYALADAMLDERKSFDKTDFLRRYEERHNLKPDPSFITNYYDGVWIIAEAIRQVGEDPAKIRDFVAGLKDFNGITRAYTADAKGTMTNSVVIVRYDESKTQLPVRVFTDRSAAPTPDKKEIVIGATVPMTGSSASSGLLYYNALLMAEEDINRAGGINGLPVRIAIEDAQSSNSTAVNAFVKVVQEQQPAAVLISSFTPQNFAVEPEVRRAAIPTFYAGGADGIHKLGNPWMFRIKQPDSVVAAAMADVALKDLGTKRPAVLFAQNDYGQGMADEMRNLFRAAGLDLVVESYPLDENDFGTHLLSIANQGADVLLSVGYVRDTALMLGARRSLGLKFPVVTNPSLALPSALALVSGEDVDGAHTVMDAYLPARAAFDPSNFLGRYLDRYKIGADPSFVTNYYDTALMLADAMRAVGTEPEALRAYFSALKDRPGITRTYTTDSFGNMGRSAAIVKFTSGTKDFTFVRNFEIAPHAAAATQPTPDLSVNRELTLPARPSRVIAFLQTLFNGLAIGCIYALLALGFVLVYEATGVVNFAAGQFVVVGAFLGVSAIGAVGAVVPGTMLALATMIALGVLFFFAVYRPLQRSPVVTVIVGTIAVGIIVQNICLLVWGPLPQRLPTPFGTAPMSLGGVVVSAHILAVIAITALIVGGLYALLYRTVLGARMRAVAQDAETAKLMGINVAGIYALTWALAGGLAGLGGLLMGPVWFVDSSMGDALALKSFAATIIGGFGSVPGAIAGGVIVGLAEALGAAYVSSTYKDALVFLLMVGFLLVRPQGIFGEFGGDRG